MATDDRLAHGVGPELYQAEVTRLNTTRPDDLAAVGYLAELAALAPPDAQLPGAVEAAYRRLNGVTIEETGQPAFPDLSVHMIVGDRATALRSALARILMRIEDEPDLLDHRPSAAPGELQFASAWNLQSDLGLTRAAYVGPLLLCLSPWIWGFSAGRVGGVIVYNLGRPLIGRSGEPAELLQLLLPPGVPGCSKARSYRDSAP